jgi:hypothetical protein
MGPMSFSPPLIHDNLASGFLYTHPDEGKKEAAKPYSAFTTRINTLL